MHCAPCCTRFCLSPPACARARGEPGQALGRPAGVSIPSLDRGGLLPGFQQRLEPGERPVGRGFFRLARARAGSSGRIEHARMLVFVAVDAQQLPVAAVGRIIFVIAVLVVHGQELNTCSGEFARSAGADPGKNLQRPRPIALLALLPRFSRLGDEAVHPVRGLVVRGHVRHSRCGGVICLRRRRCRR